MKSLSIKKTISLILIIIWMIAIFAFSNQQGTESGGTSGRATQIILDILSLGNNLSIEEKQDVINLLDPIIRKLAHFTIYFIGGILLISHINLYKIEEKIKIAYSILIGMLYATSDELHQLFIEGRSCMVTDIFLDTLGIATGVIMFCIVKKILKKSKS